METKWSSKKDKPDSSKGWGFVDSCLKNLHRAYRITDRKSCLITWLCFRICPKGACQSWLNFRHFELSVLDIHNFQTLFHSSQIFHLEKSVVLTQLCIFMLWAAKTVNVNILWASISSQQTTGLFQVSGFSNWYKKHIVKVLL